MTTTKTLLFIILLSSMIIIAPSEEMIFLTQDFEPFSYIQGNEVAGPAAEIIQLVCMDIGVKPKFQLLPWRRAINMARDGKADGLFVVGWNHARTEWLYFSHPILTTEYGIFVRADSRLHYRTVADLKGLTIAVYGPSNTSKSLEAVKREIKNIRIDLLHDDILAFKKLSAGRIDAVYSNRNVGLSILKRQGIKHILYAGKHRSLNYHIGFVKKKTTPKFVDRFNRGLIKFIHNGQVPKILEQANLTVAAIKTE